MVKQLEVQNSGPESLASPLPLFFTVLIDFRLPIQLLST